MALVPTPNLSGTTNNYAYAQNVTDQDDQFNFRIDQNFSDKQRTFVRGTRDANQHVANDLFNKANGANGGWTQTCPLTFSPSDIYGALSRHPAAVQLWFRAAKEPSAP